MIHNSSLTMAVKTAAFLLISAGDKNNYRVAQSKKNSLTWTILYEQNLLFVPCVLVTMSVSQTTKISRKRCMRTAKGFLPAN